jgi:hypothetical protein
MKKAEVLSKSVGVSWILEHCGIAEGWIPEEGLPEELQNQGLVGFRELENGDILCVLPLTFNRARLTYGPGPNTVHYYDWDKDKEFPLAIGYDGGADHVEDYDSLEAAIEAMRAWPNNTPGRKPSHGGFEMYPEMNREEILALPKEEQVYAFRANPQVGISHLDCRCKKCRRYYSLNVEAMDIYRVQCPYCNAGKQLRDTNEVERGHHWARFRAQGEQRLFSIIHPRRATVVRYKDQLPVWELP